MPYRDQMTTGDAPPPIPPPPAGAPWPQPAPGPFVASPKTNGFAIAALVCPLVVCGIGSILGIVFGHLARSQFRKTGEGGSGLALAGLIIGYVSLALGAVAVAAIIVLAATFNGETAAVDHARDIDNQIVAVAVLRGVSPRDPVVIRRAVAAECCERGVTLGASGVNLDGATMQELRDVGWRLDVESLSGDHACLTVPAEVPRDRDVVAGRC